MKFRKNEIVKYDNTIGYIRRETQTGRDFWSSLFSAGLTFTEDIERFCKYASQINASDISEPILKDHPEFVTTINNQ